MALMLVIGLVALLAGLAVGWFARAGSAARAEAQAAEVAPLRAQLGEVIVARDAALRDLAVERAAMGERAQAFEARLTELREAKEALSAQFSEVGAKLLGEAQRQFLERADQRFAQAGDIRLRVRGTQTDRPQSGGQFAEILARRVPLAIAARKTHGQPRGLGAYAAKGKIRIAQAPLQIPIA